VQTYFFDILAAFAACSSL